MSARPGLCGGDRATGVPTAIGNCADVPELISPHRVEKTRLFP